MTTSEKPTSNELHEEAVTLVLAQRLTPDDAAQRMTLPEGTLPNRVNAAKRRNRARECAGKPDSPELAAEVLRAATAWPGSAANWAALQAEAQVQGDDELESQLLVVENLLEQRFAPTTQKEVWITCISSMSRRGNCHDDVGIQSFWGGLKNEMVHH